jgi:osmotically inducible protein OsmC
MERFASTQWRGNLKHGMGFITLESGAFSNLPYSFQKRFGDEKGANPEELLAAAHSACFAMAMSEELEKMKLKVEHLDVRAIVSIENHEEHWRIPRILLEINAKVFGATRDKVNECAQAAKSHCLISITSTLNHQEHRP